MKLLFKKRILLIVMGLVTANVFANISAINNKPIVYLCKTESGNSVDGNSDCRFYQEVEYQEVQEKSYEENEEIIQHSMSDPTPTPGDGSGTSRTGNNGV